MPPLITPEEARQARRDRGPRRDRGARRACLEGTRGALRRLHRHVLAGQRQVGRVRGGLRLLRPVPLRRGRDADARDDDPGADPRARARGRGRGRPPLLHGHPGPGALQEGLRFDPRGRAPGGQRDQPQALRVGRAHERQAGAAAQGRRHPAGAPQRGDRRELLRRGVHHGALRGPAAHHRRGEGGRPRDLCRGHPQPRRVPRAAGGDGLRAGQDRPHQRADQHAQPAARHQVRGPRLHGPVGGGEVDRHLPADPSRRALPPLRWPGGEPGRPPQDGRQGRDQRGDDGQLPHHAGLRARGRPGDVRGARPERGAPGGQRREPPAGQPVGLARRRDAGHADRRAHRQPGRRQLLEPRDPAPAREEGQGAAASRRRPERRPRSVQVEAAE